MLTKICIFHSTTACSIMNCDRCIFSATDGTEQCIGCDAGMDPATDGLSCVASKYADWAIDHLIRVLS